MNVVQTRLLSHGRGYSWTMLAHIGGLPVEENLIYLAPVVLVVGFIYVQGWRERRHPERYGHLHGDADDDDLTWRDDDRPALSDELGPDPQDEAAERRPPKAA